jgi:hypothetical protein
MNDFLDDEFLPLGEVHDGDPVEETPDEYGVVSDDPPGSPPPPDLENQNEEPTDA